MVRRSKLPLGELISKQRVRLYRIHARVGELVQKRNQEERILAELVAIDDERAMLRAKRRIRKASRP